MEIDITGCARDKIHGLLVNEGADGKSLRLLVVRTHCMDGRGHGYDIRVADAPRADDATVRSNGLSLLVDPASARLLGKVQIDYLEGFEANGFNVTNSNAIGQCPCGHHDLFH